MNKNLITVQSKLIFSVVIFLVLASPTCGKRGPVNDGSIPCWNKYCNGEHTRIPCNTERNTCEKEYTRNVKCQPIFTAKKPESAKDCEQTFLQSCECGHTPDGEAICDCKLSGAAEATFAVMAVLLIVLITVALFCGRFYMRKREQMIMHMASQPEYRSEFQSYYDKETRDSGSYSLSQSAGPSANTKQQQRVSGGYSLSQSAGPSANPRLSAPKKHSQGRSPVPSPRSPGRSPAPSPHLHKKPYDRVASRSRENLISQASAGKFKTASNCVNIAGDMYGRHTAPKRGDSKVSTGSGNNPELRIIQPSIRVKSNTASGPAAEEASGQTPGLQSEDNQKLSVSLPCGRVSKEPTSADSNHTNSVINSNSGSVKSGEYTSPGPSPGYRRKKKPQAASPSGEQNNEGEIPPGANNPDVPENVEPVTGNILYKSLYC